MREYNVWQEGYSITGNYAQASFVGSTTGKTFGEACRKLLGGDPDFNMNTLSVWGCRLFDNEADARASFG